VVPYGGTPGQPGNESMGQLFNSGENYHMLVDVQTSENSP